MESGSWRVKEWVPAWAIMIYGSKFFSESFLEGLVDQKYLALSKIRSPTLKSSAEDHLASVGP